MSEWREVPLGELVRCQSGFAFKSRDWTTAGVPVVKIRDVRSGLVRLDGVSFVAADTAAGAESFLLRRGDVLITMSGEIGSVGVYKRDRSALLNQRVGRFELLDSNAADLTFLAFALQDPTQKQYFESVAYGAAQPNISPSLIGRARVRVPSLTSQRRIAAVLSAFDKLMEINERRIELLEDMARSLYREWFVRFRFPGHEDVALVESELGRIPEAWRVLPTESVLAPIGGGTPSKKCDDYWVDGRIPWFTPSDLTRASRRYVAESERGITARGLAESGARKFPPGSVLMTSRATLGVLAIATLDSTCNQGFIVIPPVEGIPPTFVYEWLSSQASELEAIATGATFKEITKTAFKRFSFLRPDADILASFGVLMQPLEADIEICERHNRHLAATRDLLLPRLVTGRLDISDLDLGGLPPAEAA